MERIHISCILSFWGQSKKVLAARGLIGHVAAIEAEEAKFESKQETIPAVTIEKPQVALAYPEFKGEVVAIHMPKTAMKHRKKIQVPENVPYQDEKREKLMVKQARTGDPVAIKKLLTHFNSINVINKHPELLGDIARNNRRVLETVMLQMHNEYLKLPILEAMSYPFSHLMNHMNQK